jgi:hypothetical protein
LGGEAEILCSGKKALARIVSLSSSLPFLSFQESLGVRRFKDIQNQKEEEL